MYQRSVDFNSTTVRDQHDDRIPGPDHKGAFFLFSQQFSLMEAQRLLARARSSSDLKSVQLAKESMQAGRMSQSLPNLQSSRATHNQVLGCALLSKPSECCKCARNSTVSANVAAFDKGSGKLESKSPFTASDFVSGVMSNTKHIQACSDWKHCHA